MKQIMVIAHHHPHNQKPTYAQVPINKKDTHIIKELYELLTTNACGRKFYEILNHCTSTYMQKIKQSLPLEDVEACHYVNKYDILHIIKHDVPQAMASLINTIIDTETLTIDDGTTYKQTRDHLIIRINERDIAHTLTINRLSIYEVVG